MRNNVTFYRVTKADDFAGQPSFTHVGDTIAVLAYPDTDSVINLTTNSNYTYGGEQGTVIPNIDDHPLYDREKQVLAHYRGLGLL